MHKLHLHRILISRLRLGHSLDGNVVYESNMSSEHLVTKFGHYDDARSSKKGAEFESVVYASDIQMLFVLSERSSVILV